LKKNEKEEVKNEKIEDSSSQSIDESK